MPYDTIDLIPEDTGSRVMEVVAALVAQDRVFLDGACWRCTEAKETTDIGLCGPCHEELT